MIVTVTPNTALDQTLYVSSFKAGVTLRANHSLWSMGGKPTDVSWILAEIGVPSRALGFCAGVLGQRLVTMLEGRGIKTEFIPIMGETRLNTVITSENEGWQTTITTNTLEAYPEHVEDLLERYEWCLEDATVVVLGGSLPRGVEPSLYSDMILMAKEHSIPVIFDAAEPNLSAGLVAGPTFIKPNRDELEAMVGYALGSLEDVYQAGRAIYDQYGASSAITLGKDGAVVVLPEGGYYIPPLAIRPVSTAGAGDAVVAGLAAMFHARQPIEDGLKLAFAAASAVCIQPGTADCRRADIDRFFTDIRLAPYQR